MVTGPICRSNFSVGSTTFRPAKEDAGALAEGKYGSWRKGLCDNYLVTFHRYFGGIISWCQQPDAIVVVVIMVMRQPGVMSMQAGVGKGDIGRLVGQDMGAISFFITIADG